MGLALDGRVPRVKAGIRALVVFAALGCAGCPGDDSEGRKVVAPQQRAPVARAKLTKLSGEVKVKRAAGDDWISAMERMALFENDKVRTVSGASAVLEFQNGSTVSLGDDALIAIAETRPRPGTDRTDLTVLKGRIDAELDDVEKKSITVSTPAATVRAGREIVFQ